MCYYSIPKAREYKCKVFTGPESQMLLMKYKNYGKSNYTLGR